MGYFLIPFFLDLGQTVGRDACSESGDEPLLSDSKPLLIASEGVGAV
jgi:hypothetical protein